MLPAIFGIEGLALTDAEQAFFRSANPLGFILFARNVDNREQLRALTDSLRNLSGRDNVPILIDQEGGRVARLKPPEWLAFPAAAELAKHWLTDPLRACRATALNYEALALDLAEVGINVSCAPVLDVLTQATHHVIGDRAFGSDPQQVARLGQACLDGLAMGGVMGVIKHIPGHGRGNLDSHHRLPVVSTPDRLLDMDLEPFERLARAPMAMTAHVLYQAWDRDRCATLSPIVIKDVIRARIGFDGLLLTDDLDMKALEGSVPALAAQALAAGCDVALNCWAKLDDMEGIAGVLPSADAACEARLQRAVEGLRPHGGGISLRERQARLLAARDRLLATD